LSLIRKACAAGDRELIVTANLCEGSLKVALSDTGSGVPPDRIDELFETFYSTKPEGMGMGLAISRSIVEAHGGSIRAASNARRGATFTFTLPIHE